VTDALAIPGADDLAMAHPYPVGGGVPAPDAMRSAVVCLCRGSGWQPLAAMVPILRMSVGGHRPQYPMPESMRFRCRPPLPVLATLTVDETV